MRNIHCRCSILNPPKQIFPIRNLKLINELLSIKACELIQQGLFCVKTCEFGSYGSCEKIACKCGEVHNRIQFLYPCNHFPSAIKTDNKNSCAWFNSKFGNVFLSYFIFNKKTALWLLVDFYSKNMNGRQ